MNLAFELIQVFDDPNTGFRGNIAAVCLMDNMPDNSVLQRLASDIAQPATTFLVKSSDIKYQVRWFAPDGEIGLCGHGSLAAVAYLINRSLITDTCELKYSSGSIHGRLESSDAASIQLQGIPTLAQLEPDQALLDGLGKRVIEYWQSPNKHIVVLEDELALREMEPDFARLRDRETFGYCVTAKSKKVDFVSRTLVPHVGQLEDHATGSSHAALVPFWANRLGKSDLHAEQLSPRKGRFFCHYQSTENLVKLEGHFSLIAEGWLKL